MSIPFPFLVLLMLIALARAEYFPKLDEALPLNAIISVIYPVFDFELDSCYPSAAISRTGKQNDGLEPTGHLSEQCQNRPFLPASNMYHRYACVEENATSYCGHSFALYMLKDQRVSVFGGGTRHEFVHTITWTKNGKATAVTYSGVFMKTVDIADVLQDQAGRPKLVYHRAATNEHCLRLARRGEKAENPYKRFVAPTIVSWYTMKGDNVTNEQLRKKFASFNHGNDSVRFENVDGRFLPLLDLFKPREYPQFPPASAKNSR